MKAWIKADAPDVGMIVAGGEAPLGGVWMECDGRPVQRRANQRLLVISTAYGHGDGRSTFNLPDLRRFA